MEMQLMVDEDTNTNDSLSLVLQHRND